MSAIKFVMLLYIKDFKMILIVAGADIGDYHEHCSDGDVEVRHERSGLRQNTI